MIYYLSRALTRFLARIGLRLEVLGRENIPSDGPVIICGNHIANYDPPLIGGSLRRSAYYLAKEELFHPWPLGPYFRSIHAIPVARGRADRESLEQALRVLRRGEALVIFPEGTRSRNGKLGELHKGVVFLARRSGVPIVPVGVQGPYGWRRRVVIRFGPAFRLPEPGQGPKADLELIRRAIMDQLPAANWDEQENSD